MNITAYRLRKLREDNGLSQREVAERIGVTRAAYNKYERGTSRPVRKLDELAALFGVSADFILGREATSFEQQLSAVDSHDHEQILKYLNLSREGKHVVDITLDAVYTQERKSPSPQ